MGTTGANDEDFRLWLVTCKHVVEDISKTSQYVMARLNSQAPDRMVTFEIPIQLHSDPRWHYHPTADIAVVATSPPDLEGKGLRWQTFLAGRNSFERQTLMDIGLCEGEEIFMLGFPSGWRSAKQDYPIVRGGVLAQLRGWLEGAHDTFMIDGSGFPGNSGGPIVAVGQELLTEGPRRFAQPVLLGMVRSREFSPIDTGFAEIQMPIDETADLVVAVSVDDINDTIRKAMLDEANMDDEDS